jgi:hypothetical protein
MMKIYNLPFEDGDYDPSPYFITHHSSFSSPDADLTLRLSFGGCKMPKDAKTRFIVRAAMTEYMILMMGAALIYLAVQAWPKAVYSIALIGGFTLAVACVVNFCLVLRTSELPTAPLSSRDARRPPPDS